MTSDEWVKELKRWFPETHVIWKVIADLRVAEERTNPPLPKNTDLSWWD